MAAMATVATATRGRGVFPRQPGEVGLGTALASRQPVRRPRPDPSHNRTSLGPGAAVLRVVDAAGSRNAYTRHEPEKSALYQIIAENLETFLTEARDHYAEPLPAYVEKELRDFLRCGLLQYGFLSARCSVCGRSILVAFSCKRRGPCCTSCGARRMCNEAAQLVDHVIPRIPVRQLVLSIPFELRLLLASRADAFGAVTSIFMQEVFRWQRERAREAGLRNARSGAVAMQHRGGSSINVHPHVHAVVPDGVFLRPDPNGRAEFHPLRAPESDDLEEIVFNIHQRFRRWLGRHGLLRHEAGEDFSNETPELSALDACAQASLGLGNLATVRKKRKTSSEPDADEDRFERRGSEARVAERDGYSLYAGKAIPGSDRGACERLLRYCLRPPLSLERLSLGGDGSVIYQVKATRRGKATQRVMGRMQFMARIVALIPPPFHPLLRYFGVFAPHSSWRSSVIAETPAATEDVAGQEHRHDHKLGLNHEVANSSVTAAPEATLPRAASPSGSSTEPPSTGGIATLTGNHTSDANSLAPQPSSSPVRPRPRWYIDWHALLARVHDVDSLACPCGGRLEFVELVTEPEVAQEILRSMGLPDRPPPVARARSPAFDPDPLPVDWE